MGTENFGEALSVWNIREQCVKLNNPLMGTENSQSILESR